jgi:hypothetical protein
MGRNTTKEEGNVSMTKSKDWVKSTQPVNEQDYTDDFTSKAPE